jgi:hypothetical protein
MDDLLEQFGQLVFNVARDMQNDAYFSGSQELGEACQTFLRDVLLRRLPKEELPEALYYLSKVVAQLQRFRKIMTS